MKNLLIQQELKKKTEKCAQLFSLRGYAKEELRDLCIRKKSFKLNKKIRKKPKNYCCA